MKGFNIRVYGILINNNGDLLVSEEFRNNMKMRKFPGGGLEFGEGTINCLKREIKEEIGIESYNFEHFYTTDFFINSAFNKDHQLLSIYYKFRVKNLEEIPVVEKPFEGLQPIDEAQCFRWININEVEPSIFTFPIDQLVCKMLKI